MDDEEEELYGRKLSKKTGACCCICSACCQRGWVADTQWSTLWCLMALSNERSLSWVCYLLVAAHPCHHYATTITTI